MAIYKKSIDTKQKIIDSSKKFFYEKGYKNTSCKEICDYAGVNLGLIHYHFKSKRNIASVIYNNCLLEVKDLVRIYMNRHYGYYDLQLGTALENWVLMLGFLKNENYRKFYYEICLENLLLDNNSEVLEFFYKLHVHRYDLDISPNEVKLIRINSVSLTMGIVQKYVEKHLDMSLVELVDYKIRNIYRYMKLDEKKIDHILNTSFEMYTKLNIEFREYFNIYWDSNVDSELHPIEMGHTESM